MFNTYRDPTGCYGNLNVESYPQNVDDNDKAGSTSGPALSAWNLHAPEAQAHASHNSQSGNASHSSASSHYHSAFHHHTGTAAIDSYGYSLAQVPHKDTDPAPGKELIRSSSPPAVATVSWQNNRPRARYSAAVASGAFLPYQTQLNHYDGSTLEATPHNVPHGGHGVHSHPLSRKQPWSGENPFAGVSSTGQYQRDPASLAYGDNIRGNVSGGIIRHTTSVSGVEARNTSTQQHQSASQHMHSQQQPLLHHQQQHPVPHHQLFSQLVQKEREAHRLPGYQDSVRHSVVRSRIGSYPEALFTQHQQFCNPQDVLRKASLPVPVDGDRRSAFTARQAPSYNASNWNKNAVPYLPFHHPQMLPPSYRGAGSAFQPCNKAGESEMYPPDGIMWSKSSQIDHGNHIQVAGHPSWVHNAQSQMFLSRQMPKQSIINNGASVSSLDTGQMEAHSVMQTSAVRQVSANIAKGHSVPLAYQQQHLELQSPHLRNHMIHPQQVPPQPGLRQQPIMSQHQPSPMSNSTHSPMVTSPSSNQSPQISNACAVPLPQQHIQQLQQQQGDAQLVTEEANTKENLGARRSLRNCQDVREFLENWDEDDDAGTPRPCVDGEAGDNGDQPLDTTELVVLDCRNLQRDEAANLITMYSGVNLNTVATVSATGSLLPEAIFSSSAENVVQGDLQNLLDTCGTSSGSSSTTIATPVNSPTGQSSARTLDMLLNSALPTPPASQEQNILQTTVPQSTPVTVVGFSSPALSHIGEPSLPKIDSGYGLLSPTSPAASLKYSSTTVNTPFVRFPPVDDPPSVIQSNKDHHSFSVSQQYCNNKEGNTIMPPTPEAGGSIPEHLPVINDPNTPRSDVTRIHSVPNSDVLPSPAPSEAGSKLAFSHGAYRKSKHHGSNHGSDIQTSLDSNSYDAHPSIQGAARSSRSPLSMASDDIDRSKWAFAQISEHARFSTSHGSSRIFRTTCNYEVTEFSGLHQPSNNSDHLTVEKGTAPLNCGLDSQKSDSTKFDKSTSPTVFLSSKDTQTEEMRQRRVDPYFMNDTFAQTSVRCIQDEIHHDSFAQTSVRCLQDEIHNDSYAQTSVQCLQDKIHNSGTEKTEISTQVENLSVRNETNIREAHTQHHSEAFKTSAVGFVATQDDSDSNSPVYKSDTNALDLRTDASHRDSCLTMLNLDKHSTADRQSVSCSNDSGVTEMAETRGEMSVAHVAIDSRLKSSSPEVALMSVAADSSIVSCDLSSSKKEDTKEKLDLSKDQLEVSSRQEELISGKRSEGRNRSVGIGTEDKYLSRIVDLSPGNIPKIRLSRLKENPKQNGVIKRLPSIRLTRVNSPMSSSGSDAEYVCSVSDANVGTSSSLQGNEADLSPPNDIEDFESTISFGKENCEKNDAKMMSPQETQPQQSHCSDPATEPQDNVLKESTHEDQLQSSSELASNSVSQFDGVKNMVTGNAPSDDGLCESVNTFSDLSKSDVGEGERKESPSCQEKLKDESMNLQGMSPKIGGGEAVSDSEVCSVPGSIQASVIDERNALDVHLPPANPQTNCEEKTPDVDRTATPDKIPEASGEGGLALGLQALQESITSEVQKISPEAGPPQLTMTITDDCTSSPSVFFASGEEHISSELNRRLNCKVNTETLSQSENDNHTCVGSELVSNQYLSKEPSIEPVEESGSQRQESSSPTSAESDEGIPTTLGNPEKTSKPLKNLTEKIEVIHPSKTSDTIHCGEDNSKDTTLTFERRDSKGCDHIPQNEAMSPSIVEDPSAGVEIEDVSIQEMVPGENCQPSISHPMSPKDDDTEEKICKTSGKGEDSSESKSLRELAFESTASVCQEQSKSNETGSESICFEVQTHSHRAHPTTGSTNLQVDSLPSLPESESQPEISPSDTQPSSPCLDTPKCEPSPKLSEANHFSLNSTTISRPSSCDTDSERSEICGGNNFLGSRSPKGDAVPPLVKSDIVHQFETSNPGRELVPKPSLTNVDSHSESQSLELAELSSFSETASESSFETCTSSPHSSVSSLEDPEKDLEKDLDNNCDGEESSERSMNELQATSPVLSSKLSDKECNSELSASGSNNISVGESMLESPQEEVLQAAEMQCPESVSHPNSDLLPSSMIETSKDKTSEENSSTSLNNQSQEKISEENSSTNICRPSQNTISEENSGTNSCLQIQDKIAEEISSNTSCMPSQDKTSEGNSSSTSCMLTLSLDDIPLPDDICHAPKSGEYQSKQIGVQVESDMELSTADKDTQSSEESFTLSDEERAFPNPQWPNFDVTRIPLPDEAAIIKTRIFKARNRKRHAENNEDEEIKPKLRKFCCNQSCCNDNDSKHTASKSNLTGPTSIATQCYRPLPSKRQFGFMSRSSQTHKIKINIRPRNHNMSPIHSHDSQTLMEVVEEVSKVLHDEVSQVCKEVNKQRTSLDLYHSAKTLPKCTRDSSTDFSSACVSSLKKNLGGSQSCDKVVFVPPMRESQEKEIEGNGSEIRSSGCEEKQRSSKQYKEQESLEECDRQRKLHSTAVKMKPCEVSPVQAEIQRKISLSLPQEMTKYLLNADVETGMGSKSQLNSELKLTGATLEGDSNDVRTLDSDNVTKTKSRRHSEDERLLPGSIETGLKSSAGNEDCACHKEVSKSEAGASNTTSSTSIDSLTNSQIGTEACPASLRSKEHVSGIQDAIEDFSPANERKLMSLHHDENDSPCKIVLQKIVPPINQSAEVIGDACGEVPSRAPGNTSESLVSEPIPLLSLGTSYENISDKSDVQGEDISGLKSDVIQEGADFMEDSDALISKENISFSKFESDCENFYLRDELKKCTTDTSNESDKPTNENPTDETETFGDDLYSVEDSARKIMDAVMETSCDIQERLNVPFVSSVNSKLSPQSKEDQLVGLCQNKVSCATVVDGTNNPLCISDGTNISHLADQEISHFEIPENQPKMDFKTASNILDHSCKSPTQTDIRLGETENESKSPNSRSTDEVHMAVGKNVYKLSSEWQTIYFEDEDEKNQSGQASPKDQSPTEATASSSERLEEPGPLGLVKEDTLARQASSEDDLPPLDAPGLEAAQVAADSDSDLEMPCLLPEARGLAERPATACRGEETRPDATAAVITAPASSAPRKEMTLKRLNLSESSSDSDSDSSSASCRWKRRRKASCASCGSSSSDSDSDSDSASDSDDGDGAPKRKPLDATRDERQAAATEAVEAAVSVALEMEAATGAEGRQVATAFAEVVRAVVVEGVAMEDQAAEAGNQDAVISEAADGDAVLSETGIEDTVIPETGIVDAVISEAGDEDAVVSEAEKGDPLISKAGKEDAVLSMAEKGDAVIPVAEKRDAVISEAEKDAVISAAGKEDAVISEADLVESSEVVEEAAVVSEAGGGEGEVSNREADMTEEGREEAVMCEGNATAFEVGSVGDVAAERDARAAHVDTPKDVEAEEDTSPSEVDEVEAVTSVEKPSSEAGGPESAAPEEGSTTPEACGKEAAIEERLLDSGRVEATVFEDEACELEAAMPDADDSPLEILDAVQVMGLAVADTVELGYEAETSDMEVVETVMYGVETGAADEVATDMRVEISEMDDFEADDDMVKAEAAELTEAESSEPAEGVDCLEISDIRTVEGDLAEWNISGGEVVPVPVDSIYNWPYVEEVLTSEMADGSDEAAEDDVEVPDDDAVADEDSGEPRPRLRCSLSWDRFLQAGEGLVLGPAKIEFRISDPASQGPADRSPSPEALEGPDSPGSAMRGGRRQGRHHAAGTAVGHADDRPWNVVDRDRSAESTASAASAHSCHEENNNHLLSGLAGAMSPGPVIKVNKLIVKRPCTPPEPPSPHDGSTEPDDAHHGDSPDGSHSLKTKGALKSYQLESVGQSRHGAREEPSGPGPGHRLSRGSRLHSGRSSRGRSRSPGRARRAGSRRRWYSQLSPASSTASWRSPGAASDGEIPKVIIKRGSLADVREARDAGPTGPLKMLGHSLGLAALAAAQEDWRLQPFVLVARDPKLDARALRMARREQRELRDRDDRRGRRKRDRDEDRERRRGRNRERNHPLQMLAEVADLTSGDLEPAVEPAVDAAVDAAVEAAVEADAKRRRLSVSPERQSQVRGLFAEEELVRSWRLDSATPTGQDTPMPAPRSPCGSGLSPGPEQPEPGHWARLLEPPSPYMAVSGDAPPEGEAVDGNGSLRLEQAYQCEACGEQLSGEPTAERADHIKLHPYRCQRCLQAFASQTDFLQHLKVVHPNSEQQHHCLLCLETFSSKKLHAEHIKGWSHCHMERSQRHTIHTLFRMFTGSDCPRLAPLSTQDKQALDWLPNDPGAIHFYHQATPLQLATKDWHLHDNSISGQSAGRDTPPPLD